MWSFGNLFVDSALLRYNYSYRRISFLRFNGYFLVAYVLER